MTDEHSVPGAEVVADPPPTDVDETAPMTSGPSDPKLVGGQDRRVAIINGAKRIGEWAELWDAAYRRDAIYWRRINTTLVVLSAILAATAAGTGLSSLTSKTVAGLMALAAAALSGGASALGASTRATQSQTTSAADSALADKARSFVETVAPYVDLAEVVSRWEKLCQERDAVVKNAPVTRPPFRRRPMVAGHSEND